VDRKLLRSTLDRFSTPARPHWLNSGRVSSPGGRAATPPTSPRWRAYRGDPVIATADPSVAGAAQTAARS
jgi:hypothetical protein